MQKASCVPGRKARNNQRDFCFDWRGTVALRVRGNRWVRMVFFFVCTDFFASASDCPVAYLLRVFKPFAAHARPGAGRRLGAMG